MGKFNYSFIVPHKNSPNELVRLVNSIPRRDDVEIIIVDDASDKQIIDWKSYKFDNDKCIQVVLSEISGGGGYARNIGLSKASGKWLLFPDADDYYSEGFLEVLDGYLESQLDVIYFGFNYLNKEGEYISTPNQKYISDVKNGKISEDWVRYKIYAAWCKMVSSSFINRYHIKFEEVAFANDRFFTFQVGYFAKKIMLEDSCLYNYIYSPQSMTNSNWDIHKSYVRVNNWMRLNPFYEKIGHPEWKNTLRSYMLDIVGTPGLKKKLAIICAWLFNLRRLYHNRNEYVEIIENLESQAETV